MEKNNKRRVVLASGDAEFAREARAAFAQSDQIAIDAINRPLAELRGEIWERDGAAAILDIDVTRLEDLEALQRLMRRLDGRIPVIAAANEINPAAMRILVQLKVADVLVKPVTTADLVRACERALEGPSREESHAAQIHVFMPTAGGVGNTVLALETAYQLHRSSAARGATTCVVDLNLQHGACAEYLDLEPRFGIHELQNRPDRLDRQLLDVMLAKHKSGLSVLAAPIQPAEMGSFNADLVVRMLDLVSAYFDHVVIDMPRTWFAWTDTVLLGADKLYLVTNMTVPCLRHTQRLIGAIHEAVGKEVRPQVIVNRFEQKRGSGGVQPGDVEAILGEHYAGPVMNNYKLVREAVDRGVPLQEVDARADVVTSLGKIILPKEAEPQARGRSWFGFNWKGSRRAG